MKPESLSEFAQLIMLGPILVSQGVWVKVRTPKLPEPDGERFGQLGEGSDLRLLILGDSAAAGVGVVQQEDALTGSIKKRLSKDFSLEWRLIAETGLNTEEVISHLTRHDAFDTDVVLISLGVNDVTGGTSSKDFFASQKKLIHLLRKKFNAQYVLLTSVPPMHLFPALPSPLRGFLGRRALRLNHALQELAQEEKATEFLSVDFPMEDAFFASDGFHPSAKAYELWSDEVVRKVKEFYCR